MSEPQVTTELPDDAAKTQTLIFRVKGHDDGHGGRCRPVAHRATAWSGARMRCGLATSRDDLRPAMKGQWTTWMVSLPCPTCERRWLVVGESLRGKRSDRVECSAKCRAATRPDCECSCAGEHHGADHA